MTPRKIRGNQTDYNSRPIATEGWKSEQHYNSYVDNIVNSKGFRSQPNAAALEEKLRMYAEGGHWRSVEKLLAQSKGLGYGSEAMVTFKRMGGVDGPNGMWVKKGMSVLQEDGTYAKLAPEEVKTLTRLQNQYNEAEGYGETAGFYANSPTQYGGRRVVNNFGNYANGRNHVELRGDRMGKRQKYLDGQKATQEAAEELIQEAGAAGASTAVGAVAGAAAARGMSGDIQRQITGGRTRNNR